VSICHARGSKIAESFDSPQADVECDFGFEFVNHECRPIQSVDTSQCAALTSGEYHVSRTKHRLVSGDVCADVSRVISDTDGKGNLPGGPGAGHKHRGRAARAFVVILVSTSLKFPPQCVSQSAYLGCDLCMTVRNITDGSFVPKPTGRRS
jgi:hypothetical protein